MDKYIKLSKFGIKGLGTTALPLLNFANFVKLYMYLQLFNSYPNTQFRGNTLKHMLIALSVLSFKNVLLN